MEPVGAVPETLVHDSSEHSLSTRPCRERMPTPSIPGYVKHGVCADKAALRFGQRAAVQMRRRVHDHVGFAHTRFQTFAARVMDSKKRPSRHMAYALNAVVVHGSHRVLLFGDSPHEVQCVEALAVGQPQAREEHGRRMRMIRLAPPDDLDVLAPMQSS